MTSRTLVSSRWLPRAAVTAAALAACAVATRRLQQRAEREHPPLGDFIEARGVRLHWRQWGDPDSPPLVLLHGNGALADDFEVSGLTALAARRWRVIAFDRPGFGYSERPRGTVWDAAAQADLFAEAFRLLGLERPIVVGHSWGTQVAVRLGLEHRDSVSALVLLSGYYFPTPRLDVPLMGAPALPVLGSLWRHTVGPLVGRLVWPLLVRKMFLPRTATAAFEQRFPKWLSLRPSQLGASAAETALMVPGAFALHERYGELAVPTVIAAGAGDRIADARVQSERLHERLPASRLMIDPGVGHMLHHTAPAEAMRAIDAAAEMVDAERADRAPLALAA